MTTAQTHRRIQRCESDGDVLVQPDWLAARMGEPGVRVVEVDVSPSAYDEWHLDGAVLWNVYGDLKDADYRTIGVAELTDLLARSGIGSDTTVVFYGYAPAFAFWLLKLYGHRDVRILDCSRDVWRTDGHPWSTSVATHDEAVYDLPDRVQPIRADRSLVERGIARPGTALVDVRSEAEFRGECFWPSGGSEPDGRAGHIPTAVRLPVDGVFDERGAFRPAEDLRRLFPTIDLDAEDEVITYCTIGGRAATAWFVLSYLLGRTGVRVYDGSWAEWGRISDVAVEQG